uniref:Phosphoinositide phospholipase C n=1 Tax=Cynoglossus semilaevis TaxID=244447 RepID=A0A3P8X4K0_CYNSE
MCSMQTGSHMTKLKGKKKGLLRFFYLDEHKSCVRWRPSRKQDRAKITIDSIHEVCEGKKSEMFRRYADNRFDPNCCFSIYYGERVRSLDLVSTNSEEARTWVTGLKYLMAGISDEDSPNRRVFIRNVFVFLFSCQEADTDENQGSLAFEEFCSFYKMISTRRDLYLIMISYSNQKEVLDLQDLAHFLENEQKVNTLTCAVIGGPLEGAQRFFFSVGFTNYMRSPAGDVFNPEHQQVNQDMTQPLNSYFIATSHNTYLTGDQLLSQSRVEMYAYVLQAGCRCVEVDCWDGPDGEPIIHHGYTLTSKILFRDVIETINKHAFTKSQYPVILSIENHCTVPQQKRMAQCLTEVLQDKLDLSNVNVHETKKLPSPESLKGKVLVKVMSSVDLKKNLRRKNEHKQKNVWVFFFFRERNFLRIWTLIKRKTMRLSRPLSDLVKYTKAVRVHDIETQGKRQHPSTSVLKPAQLLRLNQRQLLRVYPSNYRVDSSNFNPQPYWNSGCHMVAMNYQTEGRMLELNQAKFSSNGNCGYTLKPKCMWKGSFNPTSEDPLPGHKKTQLVLKVISGQQLPKPKDSMFGDRGEIIDPFVEVEIIGLPVDCTKQQTRVVDDNGFNPMWEETFIFNVLMPQIALVRFQVWDHDPIGRDFIGQRTIAFSSLMPGYRHVYLEGMADSSIFVHVAVIDMSGKVRFLKTNTCLSSLIFGSNVRVSSSSVDKTVQRSSRCQETHSESSSETFERSSEAAVSGLLRPVLGRRTRRLLSQGPGQRLPGQQEQRQVSPGPGAGVQDRRPERSCE